MTSQFEKSSPLNETIKYKIVIYKVKFCHNPYISVLYHFFKPTIRSNNQKSNLSRIVYVCTNKPSLVETGIMYPIGSRKLLGDLVRSRKTIC